MGKFEDVKRKYEELNRNTESVIKEFRMMMETETKLEETLKAGATEIGIHIQRMRDSGHPGKVITDFYRDAAHHFPREASELKEMLLVLEGGVQRLEKNVPTLIQLASQGAGLCKAWKAFGAELKEMKGSLAKAALGALGATKIKEQSTALEEMKNKIKKSESNGAISHLDSNVKDYDHHPGDFKKKRDELVTAAFKKTKGQILSDAQEEMYRQLLDERVLNGRHHKARDLHKKIADYCKTQEEMKRSDSGRVPPIDLHVTQAVLELRDLADKFAEALDNASIKHLIKQAPFRAKIEQVFHEIIGWKDDALKRMDELHAVERRMKQRSSAESPAVAAARST